MSSWYLLSAIGLYALVPGSGEYQIGASTLFKEVVISRPDGRDLRIRRSCDRETWDSFSPAKTAVWNGVRKELTSSAATISYKELMSGGTLTFDC